MTTTRPWPGISSPDWFINSDAHLRAAGSHNDTVVTASRSSQAVVDLMTHYSNRSDLLHELEVTTAQLR
jgi:hypothetical protein